MYLCVIHKNAADIPRSIGNRKQSCQYIQLQPICFADLDDDCILDKTMSHDNMNYKNHKNEENSALWTNDKINIITVQIYVIPYINLLFLILFLKNNVNYKHVYKHC